ncbi:putative transposase y4uI [Bacteroidia bacterium]|nr:putative transposase y4uI [Bacteroidia bacterium]GHU91070.1 putative transposase y4uI [Bacteroidia bacterium]GHV21008.1 putative transposase y4uI [Bacteroidia bacterium]
MAGKSVDMSKIKQVLQLSQNKVSNRQIARDLDINKETVGNYVRFFRSDTLPLKELLKMEDPELDSRFRAGNPAYTDARHQTFLDELPRFRESLRNKHVTRYLVWEEYIKEHPDGYRKSQFFHHLKQHLVASKPTTSLTDTYVGGEKLFVDFAGDTLEYVDLDTGEIIQVQVFVATLPYTDYGFALCVPSQRVEDFLYAIAKCLEFLGGVPKILVTDNLKSAVIKAERYEPTLNKALEDMGNHYHFVTIPCKPYSLTHKALVENHVKLVYRRVYAKLRNQTFYSLEELNEAVTQKMLEHNQTRMQQRPYSRQEQFFAAEKDALAPLPQEAYEMKFYCDLQVRNDGFVYLARDKHYYSVSYLHIGKRSRIIYTRTLVKIFINGEQVATHQRVIGFGRTYLNEHLASASKAILERSPEYYENRAARCSPLLKQLISDMFHDLEERALPPEFKYQTCDFMLSLQRKTPREDFERACGIAIENRAYTGKFLQNVIHNLAGAEQQKKSDTRKNPEPTNHENMRGSSHYQ